LKKLSTQVCKNVSLEMASGMNKDTMQKCGGQSVLSQYPSPIHERTL